MRNAQGTPIPRCVLQGARSAPIDDVMLMRRRFFAPWNHALAVVPLADGFPTNPLGVVMGEPLGSLLFHHETAPVFRDGKDAVVNGHLARLPLVPDHIDPSVRVLTDIDLELQRIRGLWRTELHKRRIEHVFDRLLKVWPVLLHL